LKMGIDKDKNIVDPVELRNRAENQLLTNAPEVGLYRTDSEMHRLIHELEVHQVELEMMNVELRQSRDDAEMSLEKYTDLYEFAPVGYFTLDSKGIINAVNLRAASVVGVARSRLLGQRFSLLVTDEYRSIFADFLHAVFTHPDKSTCEAALQIKGNNRVYILIEAMPSVSGQLCGLTLVDLTERRLAENDLKNYARRLIEMEEELRIRLATELHDEIGRDLTVLGMNIAIINDGVKDVVPKKLTARVKDSGKLIKGITKTVRNIMVGLRPPVLNDLGLLAALRWHTALFIKRNGIKITIQADEPFPRLTIEKETALFRISQEALMNVVKHAATQNVTIKLRITDGIVCFAVSDDGNGFLPASSSYNLTGSGWGMTIMRERAELNGGNFHVDSTPGKGTTVSVVMPLKDI